MNIVSSGLPDVEIPNVTIHDFIFPILKKWGGKTALQSLVTEKEYTYHEVVSRSVAFGRSLQTKFGLGKGDVIATFLYNVPEYFIVVFGSFYAGITLTPINPLYTPEETSRQLNDANVKVIVTINDVTENVTEAVNLTTRSIPLIVVNHQKQQSSTFSFEEMIESLGNNNSSLEPVSPDTVALLVYSSGTTSLPKGVEITHTNVVSVLCIAKGSPLSKTYIPASHDYQDVVPVILPLFHIYGLILVSLQSLLHGCKLVTVPKFTPKNFTDLNKKHKPHVMYLVPPLVHFIINNPEVTKDELASVRVFLCGAANLSASDENRLLKKAGKNACILQGYGMTEATSTLALRTLDDNKNPNSSGSVGKPVANSFIKIVPIDDPESEGLGPGVAGEILLKGPQVMRRYHNRPEETKQAFCDGWLRTGDVGYYNEDHFLFLTDRTKEMIKVKAFQVSPVELEEVLRRHPAVADAAVIGIPHETWGEVPRGYVVLKRGVEAKEKDFEEFVAGKVAKYKALKGGVEIVGDIPKNAAGKILRRKIKTEYLNRVGK